MATFSEEQYLAHYGTPRHSGRYPWGSGHDEEAGKRNKTLLDTANELRAKGLSETQIAKGLDMSTTQLRDLRTIVRNSDRQDQIHMAQKLKEKGMSNGAIAERMRQAGYKVSGESQVRALLQPTQERKARVLDTITDRLRKAVDEKEFLDVGAGVEFQLNVTSTMMRSAIQKLKNEGYQTFELKIEQATTGKMTNFKVLVKPGVEWADVQRNRSNIKQFDEYSEDGGLTVLGMSKPISIDPKRVGVRYADQGGADADGVIYVRPGVSDVSLGKSRYAQVRIAVGDTHYLKGMAVHKDDLPDGVDLMFNTSKSATGNKLDAMKKLKRVSAPGDDPSKPDEYSGPVDWDNPFGASIKRQIGTDPHPAHGRPRKLTSVMNIVNDEGDWDKWSRTLSSQMLSKQKPVLAKEQLDETYNRKKTELAGILALNNPSVKKKLLGAFAEGADSSAVHLKAVALPRQKTQVILPINSMKTTEVYAPNFHDGDRVVLIRFPHGGTFEIPELTVNNRNAEARKLLGTDAKDAIGIHSKVAERLSGADFDGDSVLIIPNNDRRISTSAPLEGLRKFNPKESYPPYEGMKRMTEREKGHEMGSVSNLITDMTIQKASMDEIARAVRHSMVVIDAEKHELDWRRSASENGIAALKKKYQSDSSGRGAATLISRASSRKDVLDRKERSAREGGPIDPKTGKKVFVDTGRSRTFVDDKGKQHIVPTTIRSTKLAETDDAHTLSSGTVIEKFYADHSNRLKDLANQARKEQVQTKAKSYSPSARLVHKDDVDTLNSKLNRALKNAPLERQAQVIANATIRAKMQSNPDLRSPDTKTERQRVKAQALVAARARTGADKQTIEITPSEWLAIQSGAITPSKLDKILTYADLEKIKEMATPRITKRLTPSAVSKAKAMHARGYTWAEIASSLGISPSAVQKAVSDEGGD